MLDFLIRRFVKDADQVDDPDVRAGYGVLTGGLGIALNLLLFSVKLAVGLLTRSMAIVSDAFNNLSDTGSSLISLIGMRMSTRRPDAEHPFGHGRIEYIAALLVAVMIVFVGVELIRESIPQLARPETGALGRPMALIMLLSIGVKLWMLRYNKKVGERINSGVILAAAQDSKNDVITTSAVLLATLVRPYVRIPIDAIAGLAVALLILRSGYEIAKDTIGQLLGGRPDPELVKRIADMVNAAPGIVGLHDMIVHDYGPGRAMASVHAEVPDDMDIHVAHGMIDEIELQIRRELGIQIVIHMDPVTVGDEKLDKVKSQICRAIEHIDQRMSMHDLRMVQGENKVNLIFDLVMPFDMDKQQRETATRELQDRMQTIDPRYNCVMQLDEDLTK